MPKDRPIQVALTPTILLVDDNPGDLELTQIAFEQAGVKATFKTATNGAVALNLLRGYIETPNEPRPDLILLDLNMPKVSGFEVLAFVKGQGQLKNIPIVILTTSNSPHDRARCASMGADDYLVKPSQFDEFVAMVKRINQKLKN